IRIFLLSLLVLLFSACNKHSEPALTEYAVEVFNPKWMAGILEKTSGTFFLVGEQGSIIHSNDGRHWRYANTPVNHKLRAIASDSKGKVLITVGDKGTILRSDNGGDRWVQAELQLPKNASINKTDFRVVIHDPNKNIWLAAGTHNAIARSSDQGQHWKLVSYNNSAAQREILSLFIEPQSGDLLFAAQRAAMGRSSDGGLTWKIDELDMQEKGNYIPHIVGFHPFENTLIATADLGRLLISKNAGKDWTLQKLPTRGYFTDSAYDPIHKSIVLTTQMGEVARSIDNGQSWQLQTLSVNNWPSEDTPRLSAIVYDKKSRSFLVVGNSGVIARSQDGGKSWHSNVLKPVFNLSVTTLLHDPQRDLFVIAGFGGFLLSGEGLASAQNPQQGWELIRPGIEQYMRKVVHLPNSNTFVVVGQLGSILRSENDGRHWQSVEVDYPHPNQPPHLRDIIIDENSKALIAAGPAGSIVRSSDAGRSWSSVFQGPIHKGEAFTQILVDKKRNTLLACEVLYQSVYRSGDGGLNWKKLTTIDSNGRRLWRGAVSEKLDLMLMVGQRGAVSISRDGGETWKMGSTATNNDLYGAFIDERSATLFATGKHGTIVRSEDGEHWEKIPSGTTNTLRRIVTEPTTGALLALGQHGTIIRSNNNGLQWSLAKSPGEDSELREALLEPDSNHLLAIGSAGVILRSADQGEHWQRLNSHTQQNFRSADFNPATGTLIVVGDGLLRFSRK
ncbi:MAG: hypothetical protein JKY66_06630, partial [Spongiibacteraceae bacterium]|nr:hypothetical protein [Spongiibacteraceae bacterium]